MLFAGLAPMASFNRYALLAAGLAFTPGAGGEGVVAFNGRIVGRTLIPHAATPSVSATLTITAS